MRNALRLVSVAAATAAALALAKPAFSAYESATLRVDSASKRLAEGGSLTVRLTTARTDDPTSRITVYVPHGYAGNFAPAPGTQIGTVAASAQPLGSPGSVVRLTGVLRADAPAGYRGAAVQCLASPAPDVDSVWLIVLDSPTGGAPVVVPSYVSAGLNGAEANLGQGKLTLCLPPPAQLALQAKLFATTLTLTNVLTNPRTPGSYRWRAIFVPHAPAAGAVEAQAVDTVPARITVRAGRYDRRTRRLTVTGTVTEARAAVAAPVRVLVDGRRAATVRANARGQYRAQVRIRRPGRHALRATTTVVPRTVAGCQPSLPLAGLRCLRSVVSGFTVATAIVRVSVRG